MFLAYTYLDKWGREELDFLGGKKQNFGRE
jgi:hypothetical protein